MSTTGKRVWHFQTVHHDLLDYDNPAAPILGDITVDGRRIKAVVQVTKQSFAYVLDRVTGKPVWPIEERPVPPSTVPGERASATQPFPTKPPAFDRQGVTIDDLIDFTPELRAEAIEIVEEVHDRPGVHAAVGRGRRARTTRRERSSCPARSAAPTGRAPAFDPETGHALRPVDDEPVRRQSAFPAIRRRPTFATARPRASCCSGRAGCRC